MDYELLENASIADHLIKRYGDNVKQSHIKSACNDLGGNPAKVAKLVRKRLGKDYLGEEVEAIDELSKKTLGNYIRQAAHDMSDKSADSLAQSSGNGHMNLSRKTGRELVKGIKNRSRGIRTAVNKLTKEETNYSPKKAAAGKDIGKKGKTFDKIAASAAKKYGSKEAGERVAGAVLKKLREQQEPITEARGRPRKVPLDAKAEPEARQHIIQQLQRAKTSMRGGEAVTFTNGEKHQVKANHATTLLNKFADMKPVAKAAFQKKIGSSHQGLMSEL
jgi:hypothetical protein